MLVSVAIGLVHENMKVLNIVFYVGMERSFIVGVHDLTYDFRTSIAAPVAGGLRLALFAHISDATVASVTSNTSRFSTSLIAVRFMWLSTSCLTALQC